MVFLDTPVNKLVVPSFRVRGPDEFHDGINGFPGRCFAENKKIIFTERMFQNGTVGKAGSVRVHIFSDSGSDSGAISVEMGRSQQIPFPKADAMASPLSNGDYSRHAHKPPICPQRCGTREGTDCPD